MSKAGETKQLKDTVLAIVQEIFEHANESAIPQWEAPYASLTIGRGKPGIYVSVTNDCEYEKIVPWDEFVDCSIDMDDEDTKQWIPRLEALVAKMKARLES